MGRIERIARIDRAIALAPDRAWYRETHAIYCIDLHRFEQAAADLDTAIVLADRPYLRFLRGLVTCERGVYRGRALARAAVGRNQEALVDANRLVTLAPQQGESYYARGVALSGLGRDRDAIADFDESLRRRPELVYPLRARAASYERLGDSTRAVADRDEARRKEEHESNYAICLDPFRY